MPEPIVSQSSTARQPIPACTSCGAPDLDRWCAVCHDRMEAAYADAEAERLCAQRADSQESAADTDVF
jgi:hypothetical protein